MNTKNEYTTIIGRRVREHRVAAGMTQEDLAAHAEVSQPTISRIEKGEGVVDAPSLLLLAEGLGVRVGALLGATLMEGDVVAAGRPAADDSAMDAMKAVAREYLADFRRVTALT